MPSMGFEGFRIVECGAGKGAGLFAGRRFSAGEAIYPFDYWSQEVTPMHLTNHSCDPNAAFNEAGMLVALRDIEEGDEITYNYLLHPTPASPWNFKCQCGAANCVGWVEAGRTPLPR